MKISALKILELNPEHGLLENLAERELENPEGSGIDLRVGQVNLLVGNSFLEADETGGKRHSPKTTLIGNVEKDGNRSVVMKPGDYLLVTTMETIYAPEYKIKFDENFPEGFLIPKVWPRSTLQRGGVSLHATKTDPGYRGQLTFGISNLGDQEFTFELGARMFNVEYEVVVGEIGRAYSGQHQGGRVTSGGKSEIQN
jgi:deoxycytidine triphosphate deaminase